MVSTVESDVRGGSGEAGGGLIQLELGPSNPIKRRGIRAGGAPSCSIKLWSTLLKHTHDGTHSRRYTHSADPFNSIGAAPNGRKQVELPNNTLS